MTLLNQKQNTKKLNEKEKNLILYNHLINKNTIISNFEKMTMYVCGPTLYDELHIGNGRSLVVFDTIYRIFKQVFKEVIYVRNITDIDDKIINKALSENTTPKDIVNKYEKIFKSNLNNLNMLKPTFEPKATEFVNQMITYITNLIEKGFAYVTFQGNVYFAVNKLNRYDFFQNPNALKEAVRVENKEDKNHWQDFALWKKVDDNFAYESPWSYGRPGWHLECSVMSQHYLGDSFLLHGGGEDLSFPHHHNEIAQGFGHNNKCCSEIFLHNGLVQFDGNKMSKSLGNTIKISDLCKNKYEGDVLRYLFISTYYNSSLNITDEVLLQSKSTINKVREFKFKYIEYENINRKEVYVDKLLNNINTPETFTHLFSLMNRVDEVEQNYNLIINTFSLLGFDLSIRTTLSKKEIHILVEERTNAKNNKNYKLSDEIRAKLENNFVKIEDKKDTSIWFYI